MGPPTLPQQDTHALSIPAATPQRVHRRAHSSINSIDSVLCSSPVGGLDGVDPNLVAVLGTHDSGSDGSLHSLATSPTRRDLSQRFESLQLLDTPGSATPRRAEALRLQRVPRSVVLASDVAAPLRTELVPAAPLTSPHASPTEQLPLSQPTVHGLGLGLPSLDVRRYRSIEPGVPGGEQRSVDWALDERRARQDAAAIDVARTYKQQHWAPVSEWPDWTAAVPASAPLPPPVLAYWTRVQTELASAGSRGVIGRLRGRASAPTLGASPATAAPAPPVRREQDVFGAQKKPAAPNPRARVTSERIGGATKRLPPSRRPSSSFALDDSAAAQRQQLWNEVVTAKRACDDELDRILLALLVYADRAYLSHNCSPDTTVMMTDDHSFDTYEQGQANETSDTPDGAWALLETLTVIATELRGLSLPELLARPTPCRPYITRVQELGSVWDEHPEWQGRGWYVELLLAIAAFSRVVEWWDAEHRFWSMCDEKARVPSRAARWLHGSAVRTDSGDSSNASPVLPHADGAERVPALDTLPAPVSAAIAGPQPTEPRTNLNMIMELSVDEERILYLSPAWKEVIGTDPAGLLDVPIGTLLAAESTGIFTRATRQLCDHTSHTVEIVFAMAHLPTEHTLVMEAQGMLISRPTRHTMWVLRQLDDTPDELPSEPRTLQGLTEDVQSLNMDMLLCRICERDIPAWFFEKHSEICNEVHRLEMEIGTYNESLLELRETVQKLEAERWTNEKEAASALLQDTHRALEKAMAISTPSIQAELPEGDTGPLLSPTSEHSVQTLPAWTPAKAPNAALAAVVSEVQKAITDKIHAVNRMRNTIVYVETVRRESEQNVTNLLHAPPVTVLPPGTPVVHDTHEFLFEPSDDAAFSEEDDVRSTSSSPRALRSPIPIPVARRTLRQSLSTPPASPRPNDARLRAPSPQLSSTPHSPSMVPPAQSRATTASIKDFELLKPISKGAYGSVYLARKRATGDHYAMKVLKKADMIAKNQITNVRAERVILMNRALSPFVVRLFFTFQSPEYLYLVMEFLPGGDLASLVKVLGTLPEAWAKQYLAEIVHGLAYLHSTGVVHRDMKPDNLLIDARGHLKLTDFGLSKFGLLGRQSHVRNEPTAVSTTWAHIPDAAPAPVPLASVQGSGAIPGVPDLGDAPPKSIVGTPDYLAPETILGVGMDEFGVDWWAVGVILFELLCGYPPFHAQTPSAVFDKILTRTIQWDPDAEMSDEARDLIQRLICIDRTQRLGARGVDEIREHPFFAGIDWTHLLEGEGPFVPRLNDALSTDYFDPRGAVAPRFDQEVDDASVYSSHGTPLSASSGSGAGPNEFGSFSYKNLPVLKQANDEVVRRIRTQSSGTQSPAPSAGSQRTRSRSRPRPATLHRRAHSDLPRSLVWSAGVSTASEASSLQGSDDPPESPTPSLPHQAHVLVADDNPVSSRALATVLQSAQLGATFVTNGAEVCRMAMAETHYDAIFVKLALRVVNGQDVARMIKSTRNVNAATPIIALALREVHVDVTGSVFDGVLPLPATSEEVLALVAALPLVPIGLDADPAPDAAR